MARLSVEERFWSSVQGGDVADCWIWTGNRNRLGYGQFYAHGKYVRAHRWAYEDLRATIEPPWLALDHLCSNPPCVNPWHLDPVTHWVNVKRAVARGRWRGVYTSPDQVRPSADFRRIPNYRRAIEDLKSRLQAGEWAAGDLFLTDDEIRQRYHDVNAVGSRAVLEWLKAEGLVRGQPGEAVYVTERSTET